MIVIRHSFASLVGRMEPARVEPRASTVQLSTEKASRNPESAVAG
jgi:hypothetical protein